MKVKRILCPECNGGGYALYGWHEEQKCHRCLGSGYITVTLEIEPPPAHANKQDYLLSFSGE